MFYGKAAITLSTDSVQELKIIIDTIPRSMSQSAAAR